MPEYNKKEFQEMIAEALDLYGVQALGDMIEIYHTTIKRWGKGECSPSSYIETYVRKVLTNASSSGKPTEVP
jgi:hypothetical protein